MAKTRRILPVLALALMWHGAQAVASEPTSPSVTGHEANLSVTVTPFSGWVPGIDGTVGGRNATVDVSLSPLDAMRNIDSFVDVLDGIYIGWGEFRYGRVGLFYDVFYLDVSSAESIDRGVITLGLDLAFRQSTGTFAATYRVWEEGRSHWDLMAGARVSDIDIRIAANLNALRRTASRGESWTDAIVGMKGRYVLAPQWSLSGWGLVGGGGSDLTWDLYGAIDYTVRPGFDLSLGFRGMKIDYSSDDFTWDVLQYGPVFNATFRI
jgi:hypothetical protein